MISSSQAFWGGAFVFLAGALLGGLFFRWKQRKLHASRVAEEKSLQEKVRRENELRNRQETLEGKEAALGAEREELGWLLRLRKEQLQKLSQLSETEARGLLLKEVEREALQDAADLTRHILDDARLKAEEQA